MGGMANKKLKGSCCRIFFGYLVMRSSVGRKYTQVPLRCLSNLVTVIG